MSEPIYCDCFNCTSTYCNSCSHIYYNCRCLPQYKKRVDNVSCCCICDQEVNENIDGWVDIHKKRNPIPAGFIRNCSIWCLFKIHYSCIYYISKNQNVSLNEVGEYIDNGICTSHFVSIKSNFNYFYNPLYLHNIIEYIVFIICYNLKIDICLETIKRQFFKHCVISDRLFYDIKIIYANDIIQYLPKDWSNEFINYIVNKVGHYIITVKNIKQIIIARTFKAFKLRMEIKRRIEMRKGAQLFKPLFEIVMNQIKYQPGNQGYLTTENHWNSHLV